MKDKFESYSKALNRLKEAIQVEPTELNLDATIQRFEFAYELAWNTLKLFLRKQGIISNSPRDSFKGAFQVGWIKDEETWIEMIKDRNLTSHIYDEKQALNIYNKIKTKYFNLLILLKNELEVKL